MFKFAKAFGMKIKIFDKKFKQSKKLFYDFLKISDIVVLCMNFNNNNQNFLIINALIK